MNKKIVLLIASVFILASVFLLLLLPDSLNLNNLPQTGVTVFPTAPAPPTNTPLPTGIPGIKYKVFVSSQKYNGNLGGLAGADAKCQALATAAGLTGTYKAWLSSANVDAISRIFDGEYSLVDGTVVANNRADLLDGSLWSAINKTELNTTSTSNVWTGTKANGLKELGFVCNDWITISSNGKSGLANKFDTTWTDNSIVPCSVTYSLYCFQTVVGPSPTPSPSKTVTPSPSKTVTPTATKTPVPSTTIFATVTPSPTKTPGPSPTKQPPQGSPPIFISPTATPPISGGVVCGPIDEYNQSGAKIGDGLIGFYDFLGFADVYLKQCSDNDLTYLPCGPKNRKYNLNDTTIDIKDFIYFASIYKDSCSTGVNALPETGQNTDIYSGILMGEVFALTIGTLLYFFYKKDQFTRKVKINK